MSDFVIYVDCEDYLKQWIIFTSGGEQPVRLKKGSPESLFLELMLQKRGERTDDLKASDSSLKITLPQFRHKNPETYNYLSQTAREALLRIFRRRFDFEIWSDLCTLKNFFSRKDRVTAAWMEAHGIELTEKNELAVTKRLQRLSERMKASERMKKTRKTQ